VIQTSKIPLASGALGFRVALVTVKSASDVDGSANPATWTGVE